MDPIKNIISDVIGRMASGMDLSCQDIQAAWERISKDHGSRVEGIKDGCVTISADSSLRLVKLNLNRDSLLKEMKKEFPSVNKINFKVGK